MNLVCNKCGRAPAGVTHICPPLEGSTTFTPTLIQSTSTIVSLTPEQRIADLERRVWELEQRRPR